MSAIQYHQTTAENNNPSGFTEFSTVDFVLTGEGRKLVKNSITVDFELQVFKTGTTRKVQADQIRYNNKIGTHSFFESWQCSTPSQNLENLQAYPIYVNQVATCTLDQNDYYTAAMLAEGRGPVVNNGEIGCEQVAANGVNDADASNDVTDPQHCIKPLICFNRQMGDDYSFDKMGPIRISTNLARSLEALSGQDNAAATHYKILNMNLRYKTVPDDGKKSPMVMNSYVHIKQTINSNQTNISSRVPAKAVSGVSISFIKLDRESSYVDDCYNLERLPNLDEVQYLFADNLSNNISYVIDSQNDMVIRGVQSLGGAGHNQATYDKMLGSKGFIIGQDFDQMVDLSQQKFSTQLKSTSLKGNNFSANLFFHNVLSM